MSDDTSVSSSESSYKPNEEEMYDYNRDRLYVFNCIKVNYPGFGVRLQLLPYNPVLPVSEWLQLGNNIGSNTRLQGLSVCPDGVEEEDDILSTENLDLFISGIANNRSLKDLWLEEYDFSRARLGLLHPFVIENDSLVELQLHSCGFGSHDLQMLAAAFSHRRKPTSMKRIEISGDNIVDELVPAIVDICGYCPRLHTLDLTFSNFGIQGLRILATLLENPGCKLRHLYLDGNTIDDEGAEILANSLVKNRRLKRLGLDDDKTSSGGWKYFLGILRSTSDINATSSSNHTLEGLWYLFQMAKDLPTDLVHCLQLNEAKDKRSVARKKIFHFHLNNNVDLFAEDQEILPHVLGWIGKDYDTSSYNDTITRSTAFYRIMKSYPELCGFDDRKMRNQLEVEVATLKAENATIKSEVFTLKTENEELRRKMEQLTMGK